MPIITVLTPTYNRVDKLKKLFDSLLLQENQNFVWLIIDDGSTDNTNEIVQSWSSDSNFKIIYYKKMMVESIQL